jgi:hypothetical protein
MDHANIEEELVRYYKELLSEPPVDRNQPSEESLSISPPSSPQSRINPS